MILDNSKASLENSTEACTEFIMKRSTAEVQVTHEAELSIHYVFFCYRKRDYITGRSASDEVTSSRAGAQSSRAAQSCCV